MLKNTVDIQEKLAHKMGRSVKGIQAVLKVAKINGWNIPEAARTLGRSGHYVNSCMFYLRAAATKNNVVVPEFEKLKRAIRLIRKKASEARKYGKTKKSKRVTTPVKSRTRSNQLSHIVDSEVEFKYPVITDRPITKIVETYPLRALQPGQAFAVPARKGVMKAAKKAVTLFAKSNPGTQFLQRKEKGELVIWRTK